MERPIHIPAEFLRFIHASPGAMIISTPDGLIVDVNEHYLQLLGYTREEVIGRTVFELNLFVDPSARSRLVEKLLETGIARNSEGVIRTKSGALRYILASHRLLKFDDTELILGVGVDITERHKLEVELRESEQRIQELLMTAQRQAQELTLIGNVRTMLAQQNDLPEVIRAVVEGISQTFGYTFVSLYLIEGDSLCLQHQVGYEGVIERIPLRRGVMGRVARTGQPAFVPDVTVDADFIAAVPGITGEICVPLYDEGKVVGVLNVESADPLPFAEQDLQFLLVLSEHVSIAIHRARLYTALKQSNERYQSVLDSVSQVICQLDTEGRITFVNAAWTRLLGYEPHETIGLPLLGFALREDYAHLKREWEALINRECTSCETEGRYLTDQGQIRWLRLNARALFDGEGELTGISGTMTDITEQRLAEEREQEQRRLAEALRDTAADLTTTLNIDELLDFIFEHLRRVMPPFDAARVMFIDHDTARVIRSTGYERFGTEAVVANLEMPLQKVNDWQLMVRTGQPYVIEDLQHYEHRILMPGMEWVRSLVGAPLRSKERVIGFIHLDSAMPGLFEEKHAKWLQAFADQAGTAIQNAQLYTATRRHAQELERRVAERAALFRQTKEQVEAILNTSSDSILLLDSRGKILQTNPAFTRLSHYISDEVFNHELAAYVDPEYRLPLEEALRRVLADHRPQHLELVMIRKDGAHYTVDAALDPLTGSDWQDSGAVCTMHDITERRRVEEELRLALERERRLVDLKSRFGVMVSHEFRTPLATIQASTDLLSVYYDNIPEGRRREILKTIESQVQHLTGLLDDIMAISKADTVGMDFNPAPVDLAEFCRGVAGEFQWLATATHLIDFHLEGESFTAWVDKHLLRRVLNNLLSNALKYSPNGKEIRFRLHTDEEFATIEVSDQGIGIPPDDRERLFETFHRAGNVGAIPGTGLGLAIVKRAVDMHGGEIEFHSEVGQGTTFVVRLPRRPAERTERAQSKPRNPYLLD